jgi:hypothetical protein
MSDVHHVQEIQICHDPEGGFIGLVTPSHRYAWPTKMMPSICKALRDCANGEAMPDGVNGMVVAAGGKVALTDKPPKATFQNVGGRAALVIDAVTSTYVMPQRAARRLADGFEETYAKNQAIRRSAEGALS